MSRTVIAAVVAAVIAALTAIAYFVTSTSFADRARKDADIQVQRATQLVGQLTQLRAIDVSNKAERLSSRPEFVTALNTGSTTERQGQARLGFQKFLAEEKSPDKPDIIALVDTSGEIIAMHEETTVVAKAWINEKGSASEHTAPTILPALNVVLGKKIFISDIWMHNSRLMKVGVAPVINPEAPPSANPDAGIIGAIVIAYAQTSTSAQNDRGQLGVEIAYYDNKKVRASSFTNGGTAEDTSRAGEVSQLLADNKISDGSGRAIVTIGGEEYIATAVKLLRASSKALPAKYPPVTAGAVVLAPVTPSNVAGTVKMFILLVGIGSLAIAMLGLYLSHRRLVAQVDSIELGVNDIINGNVDRTFRPVGPELDGLANALNVMLARLLGRPEPGEEEFDEEGNPIIQGRVEFDEGEERPAADPDLAALAQESEPDYYKRVYTEYLAAKRASGNPDEVSFENFIAKLKVNEGKLKAQYQCRAVRFRVVHKDGKVSLKPVPIFA